MMGDITYINPTSTRGPDGYINYKMSGGDKLGSGGGPGVDSLDGASLSYLRCGLLGNCLGS